MVRGRVDSGPDPAGRACERGSRRSGRPCRPGADERQRPNSVQSSAGHHPPCHPSGKDPPRTTGMRLTPFPARWQHGRPAGACLPRTTRRRSAERVRHPAPTSTQGHRLDVADQGAAGSPATGGTPCGALAGTPAMAVPRLCIGDPDLSFRQAPKSTLDFDKLVD
jgi:hypothetical protein